MIARLAVEFNRPLAEVGGMTRYQIFRLFGHRRNKDGRIERADYGLPASRRDSLRRLCLLRGVPDFRVEAEVRRMMGES